MFLPADEARVRIERGLELFKVSGLEPVGFVPPAWLHGPGLDNVLRERDLRITESFWHAWDVFSGARVRAPALSWSTHRQWRSDVTALFAEARKKIERKQELVRVAIHPPDIEVPVVKRSVERTLERLLGEREAVGYRDVLV
jgi:predicted deacetylase